MHMNHADDLTGDNRKLGGGIFVPHKSIAAVAAGNAIFKEAL